MIGIISAIEEELQLFKSKVEIEQVVIQAGIEFHFGQLYNEKIILLKSGVGKVNAAVVTQLLIDRFGVDKIIFTGLAGGLVPLLNISDIVVSNYVVQYDVDLTAFGRRLGEIPDLARMIEADEKLIKTASIAFDEIVKDNLKQLIVGTIATGDSFISSAEKIKWLQREFGAVAVDMEGGAVGQVCQMNKVPFVIIRVISDKASENAAGEFIFSLDEASHFTFNLVSKMLSDESKLNIDKNTKLVDCKL